MSIQYLTDTSGKKKGVFLSITDWKSIQTRLQIMQSRLSAIEKKRSHIQQSYRQSKNEKLVFSSDITHLKQLLK